MKLTGTSYGSSRDDVGAVFGSRFTNSGFTANVTAFGLVNAILPSNYATGFTFTVFPASGSPAFKSMQFTVQTRVRTGACAVDFNSGVGRTDPPETVNSATGYPTVVTPADYDSWVSAAAFFKPGCTYTIGDFMITGIAAFADTAPGDPPGWITSLDAASIR